MIFLIGFAGVWWLLQGNSASTDFGTGWDPFQGETLALGLPANLTFFSFAILALLGIETPLNMGAEVTGGEKAIRTFLLWGCAIVMAAYLWATWGNMVVIEAGGANGTTGGAETVGLSLGRWTGAAVASGDGMGRADRRRRLQLLVRTPAVRVRDGEAPAAPDRQGQQEQGAGERDHAPERDLDDPGGPRCSSSSDRARAIRTSTSTSLYAGVTIVWCISTALLFLDIFFAKRAEPERFERERRVPDRLVVPLRRRGVHRQHPRGALHLRGLVVPGVGFPTLLASGTCG